MLLSPVLPPERSEELWEPSAPRVVLKRQMLVKRPGVVVRVFGFRTCVKAIIGCSRVQPLQSTFRPSGRHICAVVHLTRRSAMLRYHACSPLETHKVPPKGFAREELGLACLTKVRF